MNTSKKQLEKWIKLLTYVFEPRVIESHKECNLAGNVDSVYRIDMDEFSIYLPNNDQEDFYIEIWNYSYGSYDTPPDAWESEFGVFKSLHAAIREIWRYRAEQEIENKLECFYDLQFSENCGIM